MTTDRLNATAGTAGTAQSTVRRLVVFVLLYVLVSIAATGLSGLLARLLGEGAEFAGTDVTGMAMALAFALVGGPLAAALWWAVWRRADAPAERSSLAWGVYVAAMYVVALIVSASSLLGLGALLVTGEAFGWQSGLSTALVWAGVWLWHSWMSRHPHKGPARLSSVPGVVGAVFGLILGVANTVGALSRLFEAAVRAAGDATAVGDPWWRFAAGSLVWALGGAAIWWWHWYRQRVRHLSGGLADVALVVTGVLGAAALALGGIGTVLYVLLRLAFDRSDPILQLLGPLPPGLASAAVGLAVWAYHRPVADRRGETVRRAGGLVVAGVALVGAASGIGVIVNSVLAMAASPLAGDDTRALLLGGISALVVGAPVWWLVWRPAAAAEPSGRRVYLVVVFGASAVVALVTLLVIGYRLFEFLLDDVTGSGLVERVRAPFGLLVATGLAAAYHFSVWRRDRSALAVTAAGRPRTIEHVVLVAPGGSVAGLESAIGDATGARVTVWERASSAGPGPDPAALLRSLEGVSGRSVLLVTDSSGRIEVIPLAFDVP